MTAVAVDRRERIIVVLVEGTEELDNSISTGAHIERQSSATHGGHCDGIERCSRVMRCYREGERCVAECIDDWKSDVVKVEFTCQDEVLQELKSSDWLLGGCTEP